MNAMRIHVVAALVSAAIPIVSATSAEARLARHPAPAATPPMPTWRLRCRGSPVATRRSLSRRTSSAPTYAVRSSHGLAYVLEDQAGPYIAGGRLIRVLADWCPPFSGYHIYYPSQRQPTPAFACSSNALRYRR